MTWSLRLVTSPTAAFDAPSVRPDHLLGLSRSEVERLPVWHGNRQLPLAEFFQVSGEPSDHTVVGDEKGSARRLGEGMAGGKLTIEGRAALHVGAGMTGGEIVVEGDADDWAGCAMQGGSLVVHGSAGAHLAGARPGHSRGMTGGSILVHGSAGDGAGSFLRRGLVAIAGDAGRGAGAHMVAGTLLVRGGLGPAAGAGMKRGTIVAGGGLQLLPTFRFACVYHPSFLPLVLRGLKERGFPVGHLETGAFRKYGGDFAELGRGEILQWTSDAT